MTGQKTQPGSDNIAPVLDALDPLRRADADTLVGMMTLATDAPPRLWSGMIGFGQYHYVYASGTEGDAFLVGFAPRAKEFSLYLMGVYFPDAAETAGSLLARLGKHRIGKACLYVKQLSDIDLAVLDELIKLSVEKLRQHYP